MRHSNIAFFIPHLGCPHQCSFCNQRSISGQTKPPAPEEIAAACRKAMREISEERRTDTEIAFFGGSFTAVGREYQRELLEAAAPFCGKGGFSGIRLSTRPDCISREILDFLKKYPVSAIELGVQSMNDEVLRLNGRDHTAEQAVEASGLIRAYGFSLGLQMMTGLYGDCKESTYETAERIIFCRPDTVRIYPTVVIRGTELGRLYEAGLYCPPTVEESVPLVSDLMERFRQARIQVIRVGLHASQELERDLLAGAYHPAFRELCEGELYFRLAMEKLRKLGKPEAEIWVAPGEVSKLVGQGKINRIRMNQAGYRVIMKQDAALRPFELRVAEREV